MNIAGKQIPHATGKSLAMIEYMIPFDRLIVRTWIDELEYGE